MAISGLRLKPSGATSLETKRCLGRKRDTDIENKHMDTKWGVVGGIGRSGLGNSRQDGYQ